MKSSRALLAALLLITLSGCTTTEGGTAAPQSRSSAEPGSSTASAPAGDLSTIDACELLSGIKGSFPTQGTPEPKDDSSCQAVVDRDHTVRINLHPELGLADYVLGPEAEPSDITIGSHKGKLVKKSLIDLDCSVAIGVGEKSRVDVFVASDGPLEGACELATKAAIAIEPSLP